MWKFLGGIILGAGMAVAYVRYGVGLPAIFEAPEKINGALVSTAVESELYALDLAPDVRQRAVSVYFASRPDDAAAVEARAGHPVVAALHRERARREARVLIGKISAFEDVSARPGLRAALERRHGVRDDATLRARLLEDALADSPFLAALRVRAGNAEPLEGWLRTLAAEG